MRLIKCDKCGITIPEEGYEEDKGQRWYGIRFEKYHDLESTSSCFTQDINRYDLCHKCWHELKKDFINKEEE